MGRPLNDKPTISYGASFNVTHSCPDGTPTSLYWERRPLDLREWLVCPRCGYAAKLWTRSPSGLVHGR